MGEGRRGVSADDDRLCWVMLMLMLSGGGWAMLCRFAVAARGEVR